MATKKKRKYSKRKQEERDRVKFDIILLIIVAISLFLILGEFGIGGVVLGAISNVTFGLFGVIAFILPIILLLGALFIIANLDSEYLKVKIISFLFALWFVATISDLIVTSGVTSGPIVSFMNGFENRSGGGFFGGLFAYFFYRAFGIYGAFIISIILLLISVIVMTGRSFLKRIKEGTDNLSDVREQEKSLRAEERERLHEERMREREERRRAEIEERALEREEEKQRRSEIEKREEEREKQRRSEREKKELESAERRANPDIEEIHKEVNEEAREKTNFFNPFKAMPSMQNLDGTGVTKATDLFADEEKTKAHSDEIKEIVKIPAPSMENVIDKSSDSQNDNNSLLPEHEISKVSVNPMGSSEDNISVSEISIVDKVSNDAENKNDDYYFIDDDNENTDTLSSIDASPNFEKAHVQIEETPVIIFEKPKEDLKPLKEDVKPLVDSKTNAQECPSIKDDVPASDINNEISKKKDNIKDYILPPVSLLEQYKGGKNTSESTLKATADRLQKTLRDFGVDADVTDYMQGPAVTRFEITPKTGVKVSKIINLSDDIKLNLAVPDIRIEAPIPGKPAVGIEVPNKEAAMVSFRQLMESTEFKNSKSKIAFAAGKDIAGNVIISDIAKMPHVLIAGATGSGKSVCINTIIMSILYKARPDEVKFIMIDPKIVELSVYNGIPHLLVPVVTDPKKAAGALQWAVNEMTKRYQRFANAGVRDMKSFNEKVMHHEIMEPNEAGEIVLTEKKMPQIIVIVDELADLMMVASKEVESAICRLAQLARAAGIHLVIATQRPSVNVITGLIKANMPSRIAFAVTSGVDSRTILDMNGAEKLLGHGDMLYFPQGLSKPIRVQGSFVSDSEVSSVVKFITDQNDTEEAKEEREAINKEIENHAVNVSSSNGSGNNSNSSISEGSRQDEGNDDGRDFYFADAGRLITDKGKASIGMLQRYLKIGFNRAARIMDELGEAGVVGPEEGTKPRRVLMKKEDFESFLSGNGKNAIDDTEDDVS